MIESAERLDAAYWRSFAILASAGVAEFFDFYVVGFLVAVVGPRWGLSYGQSGAMLLSGGVGAIAGALVFGRMADRIGRKAVFVTTAIVCGLGSAALSVVPDGNWQAFTALRLVIGVGIGGAATVTNPFLVELTPAGHRSVLTGLAITIGSLGTLTAALSAALLLDALGWRGLALFGLSPVLFAVAAIRWLPESGHWKELQTPRPKPGAAAGTGIPSAISRTADPGTGARGAFPAGTALLIALAWLGTSTAANGIYLWGPTILAFVLASSVAEAGKAFVLVSLAGLTGKLAFSFLPVVIGRRRSAQVAALGGGVALLLAAFSVGETIAGIPAFLACLILAGVFLEGGFSNLTPYTAELAPVRFAGRAVGLAQAGNGIGKVLGPLCLALIAGSTDIISPKATMAAVLPAFLFLAICSMVSLVVFVVCRKETAGRPLQL